MHYFNIDEMTFDEIITAARDHATEIRELLGRADPNIAESVMLQLAEIEDELLAAVYGDLLAATE